MDWPVDVVETPADVAEMPEAPAPIAYTIVDKVEDFATGLQDFVGFKRYPEGISGPIHNYLF